MRSALPLAAISLAAALLLSGCVPQEPQVTPAPEPTTEPVFATDEEALAAATDAYKAYLKVADLVTQEGGANPDRIASYVTESSLTDELAQFAPYAQRSLHTVGATDFDSVTLQHFGESAPGLFEVVLYVCIDVSKVRVINSSGVDVTRPDRDNRLPLEIGFEGRHEGPTLLMNSSELWHGTDFC